MNSRAIKIIRGIVASVPCFIVAATLLRTWIEPMSVSDGKWVRYGVGVMVLEFVMVHSGAMMASWQGEGENRKWKTILLMTGFYSLFAVVMAVAFKSWGLIIIFTTVMAARWSHLITDPDHAKDEAMRRSGLAVVFYLLAVFLTIFIPLPELGLTSGVLHEVYPDRGEGVWERKPETALAAGIIYFCLLGVAELRDVIKAGKKPDPA